MGFFSRNKDKQKHESFLSILKDALCLKGYSAQICGEAGDEYIFESSGLCVKAEIYHINNYGNAFSAQLHFLVYDNNRGIEFFESLAGVGKNPANSLSNGISNFMYLFDFLHPVVNGKTSANFSVETTTPENKFLSFNCFLSEFLLQGTESHDLTLDKYFKVLKQEICAKLTEEKFYFLKIYTSKLENDKVISQCLLNGEPFENADEQIAAYTQGIEITKFFGEKQFLIFMPND